MTHLVEFRAVEFDCVKRYFQPGAQVLEIGGGTGYQASLIAALGATVESIDVAEPQPLAEHYFPVRIYDGREIPFPDEQFDLVFSSNVLEHIRDIGTTLSESRRVMKPDGLAIHILPTPTWRAWTSLSHYVHIARRIADIVRRNGNSEASLSAQRVGQTGTSGLLNKLKRVLRDGPHGEYPSALSELWYFSERRWTDLFQRNGFSVVEIWPSRVFYTGYGVFPWISMERRRVLARVLGSATRIYVLRKAA